MATTLKADAEQAERAIYGGRKMARRRFQYGSLFRRGTRRKVCRGFRHGDRNRLTLTSDGHPVETIGPDQLRYPSSSINAMLC